MSENREYGQEELQLFEDIKNGRTFDRDDDLPPFYKKHLLNLLWMQGDSEYSGALGYMPWIEKAPSLQEKVHSKQLIFSRKDMKFAPFLSV